MRMTGRIDDAHRQQGPHLLRRVSQEDLQAVVARLLERDVDLRELANLIDRRPGLQAFVMTAANSVCNGLEHRVRDVHHAIVLLGIRRMLKLFDGQLDETNRWSPA